MSQDTKMIGTLSVPAQPTNSANVTTSSVTEPVAQVAAPSGAGVVGLGHGGHMTVSAVKLTFFGVGSDSTTFTAYVYGWELNKSSAGLLDLWVPVLLATFTGITLDTAQPGIAGTDVPATNFFATAITLGVGNSGISVEVVSPGHASHEIAHAIVDTKGARFLEVRFAMGGSATSGNCLLKKM